MEIIGTYERFNPHAPQNVYRGYVMEFMAGGSLEEGNCTLPVCLSVPVSEPQDVPNVV